MINRWTDNGKKGARGVEINGVVSEIPFFPLDCDVVPLSHDVGECVCVVSVKTETQKREGSQGIK